MFCKLQKGIKQEEYWQMIKVRQVVERVGFDWCDFIVMQITAIKQYTNTFKISLNLWYCVVVFQCNILNKIK